MKSFRSNGKLLISGEYVVLDGATALAVPTKFGQSLKVQTIDESSIKWKSLDHEGEAWFEGSFLLENKPNGRIPIPETTGGKEGPDNEIAQTLAGILKEANELNPELLQQHNGYAVTTELEFPKDWGLGTSSTLTNNIAQWFGIDAYILLEKSFGGSGYDIASAQNNHPVTYRLNPKGRDVLATGFDPGFKNELFFVYLNRKQNSRESIAHYKSQPRKQLEEATEMISGLTHQMIAAQTIVEFELLMEIHETIISQMIGTPKIKTQLFPDYPKAIKSLGGWGGDFILATGGEQEKQYYRNKGYNTILPYPEMVL